jgi:hypothetical protein
MLRIAKPIRYVFYRIFTWKLKDPQEALPALTAGVVTFVLLYANLFASYFLFSHLSGQSTTWLIDYPGIGRGRAYLAVGLVSLGFGRLITYLWIDNGRFAQLQTEFEPASVTRQRVRTVLFWSFIILSVVFPIAVVVYLRDRHF